MMTSTDTDPGDHYHSECRVAFKEWAAVCQALGMGEQIVILRKGGIHEGREGFRVDHGEFWLYPTRFHESADQLTAVGAKCADIARQQEPPAGKNRLALFAVVTDVFSVEDLEILSHLEGRHVWSPTTVATRFHYRQPGLFVLVARLYARSTPHEITETAAMAGCRSWVELEAPFTTAGLTPVLSDSEFEVRRREIAEVVNA